MWGRRAAAGAAATALAVGLAACTPRWESELASPNAAGDSSGNGESALPQLSADGTKVVFQSRATDLVAGDTNGHDDIYVRDLTTGTTTLVSVNEAGTDGGNDDSHFAEISADGTKVLFLSQATDLASPATGGATNIFVRDLVAGTTSLVTVNAAGTGGVTGNAVFSAGNLDPTGTKVVFESSAHDLVPNDPGPGPDPNRYSLFERDLTTGTTTRLGTGQQGYYSPSGDAIAYMDDGAALLRTTATGAVTTMSTGLPGRTVEGMIAFSTDGNKVAFERWDVGGTQRTDIYVYDRGTRRAVLATPAAGASTGSNGTKTRVRGFDPTDANRLLFTSNATNLVTNDANGATHDVFVRNVGAGATRLVTVTAAANQSGPGSSVHASWVGDGTRIAFVSQGNQFGPTDTNTYRDVYVRDETAKTYRLVSLNAAGTDSGRGASGEWDSAREFGIYIDELSVSADGGHLAFGSDAPDLGPPDTGSLTGHDIFVAELVKPAS